MNNKFQLKLAEEGYCDERPAGFCATAKRLPRGEYGVVCLCVKGGMLHVYDVLDMKGTCGELLYEVRLRDVQKLKARGGLYFNILKFEYEGEKYAFNNFMFVKPALNVIKEEANKQ